jgi:hypothetical protein
MIKTFYLVVLFLIFSFSAFSQVVKVTDFGAIPNDNLPDDAAVAAARQSLMQTGGTLEFPCGTLNLSQEQSFVQYGRYVSWKLEGNQCAIIEVKRAWLLFNFGNNPSIIIDGMTIVGTQVGPESPNYTDSWSGIINLGAYQNIIRNTKFLGLRSNDFIVHACGNTIIEDSQFDGNSAATANILTDGMYQKGLTVKRTSFVDYSNFLNKYYNKTGTGNRTWIKVTNGVTPVSAGEQRQLRVEDCMFDEGAVTAIYADNIFAVDISGSSFNVSGVDNGKGIYLDGVKKAKISGNWFGWSGFARPALSVVNNTRAVLEDITLGNQVFVGERDSTSEIYYDDRMCSVCSGIRLRQ